MSSQAATSSTAPSGGGMLVPLTASVPSILFCFSALSVALAAAQAFELSQAQTASLILGLYGIPAILNVIVIGLYRQPVFLAWHISGLVFITSLAGTYTYAEVSGAVLVAGLLVLLIGGLGISKRLADAVPSPIIFGIMAGMMMPFVARIFSELGHDWVLIGATMLAYLAARRFLPAGVPDILPAIVVGIAAAVLLGDTHTFPGGWSAPRPSGVMPDFTWRAIVSIAPVIAILVTAQSNLTMVVYLRTQRYRPPERLIQGLTGIGSVLGAFLGAVPISSGSLLAPIVAGPDAGKHNLRYWAAAGSTAGLFATALLASVAAQLPQVIPVSLLFTLAGIALIGVLSQSLTEITHGPLRIGPLFAFAVASSNLNLLGLGPLFWALVIGMSVTLLLEPRELAALRGAG